jgi:hypothetical protein
MSKRSDATSHAEEAATPLARSREPISVHVQASDEAIVVEAWVKRYVATLLTLDAADQAEKLP